jgi:hypothetical protein
MTEQSHARLELYDARTNQPARGGATQGDTHLTADTINFSVTPDSDNGVWQIAFQGELNAQTLIDMRTLVLKLLAECPAAIVANLEQCRVDPNASLTLLATLQRRARTHGVRLVYAAGDVLARHIRRDADRWFVELYPNCAQAIEAALEPSSHRWLRIELTPHPLAGADARAQAGYVCTAWGAGHIARRARVIVSELVDNSIEHAGTSILVTITALRDLLHIRVRDYSRRPLLRLEPEVSSSTASLALRGQGLRLVEQHATSWGVTPTEDGKIVWATLRIRPFPPNAAARSTIATTQQVSRKSAKPTYKH